jgi:DNA-binding GntR family transcriptional regulator
MQEWIPRDVLVRPLTDDDTALESILEISSHTFAQPIDYAIATLLPKAATAAEAATLCIPRRSSLLLLDEVFYGVDDHSVATSQVAVNPGFVRLSLFCRPFG